MSCNVLDIEFAGINVIKQLGIFINGKVQGYSFCLPIKHKPTEQAFWCTRNLQGFVRKNGRLGYSEFLCFFSRDVKDQYFAKIIEKCNIFINFLDRELENLVDRGCSKVRDLFESKSDGKFPFVRFTHSNTKLHFTAQNARQNCFVTWHAEFKDINFILGNLLSVST